jgi:glycosyltransferase involved in cell wall biosynthesis
LTLAIHLRDDGFMDACNHYRFRIPFEEMRKRISGGFFDWAPAGKVREWALDKSSSARPTDYDLILLPRHRPMPYGWAGELDKAEIPQGMIAGLQQLGIDDLGHSYLLDLVRVWKRTTCMVGEYDDDYFTASRDLRYEHYDLLHSMLRELNAVTVSTPYLRKVVNKVAPGVPVYILPNCVPWTEWQDQEKWEFWEDRVVIGLTGSKTHYDDWKVVQDVIPQILKDHTHAAFLLAGFSPDYMEGIEDEFPDQVVIHEPVRYEDYPSLIRQADIVLCPVDPDDEFNWSKSAIKAVEGMAAGRTLSNGKSGGGVPIVSDTDYYRRAVGGDKRGRTVDHTPEAWHSAITELLLDHDTRDRLAVRGHQWCGQNRAIENQWHHWWNCYRDIYRRKR